MNEEIYEEILLRIAEILRRRFVLRPKMTARETVDQIISAIKEVLGNEL